MTAPYRAVPPRSAAGYRAGQRQSLDRAYPLGRDHPRAGGIPGVTVMLRSGSSDGHGGAVHLELVSVIVDDYDAAIDFFVDKLGIRDG